MCKSNIGTAPTAPTTPQKIADAGTTPANSDQKDMNGADKGSENNKGTTTKDNTIITPVPGPASAADNKGTPSAGK